MSKDNVIVSEEIKCPHCEKNIHFLAKEIDCPYCGKKFNCEMIRIYVSSTPGANIEKVIKKLGNVK
jgi:DNA-directed RNA polymerase subunit RPC12/RpoP